MAASTYRHDPFTDSWKIVAPSRAGVPQGKSADPVLPEPPGPCAFCPGNEAETEETVASWPPGEGEWQVRVVRNRYPAVSAEIVEVADPGGHARPATGFHEVLVESREHDLDVPSFTPERWRLAMRAYRERLLQYEQLDGIQHVSVFRNRGRRAGSSQPHPHGQIVATTVAGPLQQKRWNLARQHLRREGRSLLDAVLQRERDAGARLVSEDDDAIVLCPFAPSFGFETWVVPTSHRGSFSDLPDDALDAFADRLRETVGRVLEVSGRAAYNLVWRLPPAKARRDPAAFWHVAICPRGGPGAGLELTTGMSLVSVAPEDAAKALR
ncbi:MAG TPA: hypothetical protein RMH85_03960 [Polyangiaceae bacterium LLY-WYZ-15_(1-7)]|nr:hypothetical protein [Myxococcales bacterium]MAT24729.1 hypothetical protein [Sandaracinus sp.]HJK90554.1 hypothetical protein [Polyangiaceae bacterium LLY-WYZ-15_(1-7)]MBJ72169.1 hypothetical protein [Sandaracinus sp.]HJL03886.1 hypothetical protein [Polyangiaceae bacterium LLY-WYZ-15_(1-7)]